MKFQLFYPGIYLLPVVVCTILSCKSHESVHSGSNTAVQSSSAYSPQQFRAKAKVLQILKKSFEEDTLQTESVVIKIMEVIDRGSSLIRNPVSGDTLETIPLNNLKVPASLIEKNILCTVEERIQLNSVHPVFILRFIQLE